MNFPNWKWPWIQLPLNEISQPNLTQEEFVVVIFKQKYKVLLASPTSLLATQTLKEPEMLYSLVGFEKAHGCGFFSFFSFLKHSRHCHNHSVSVAEMTSVTIRVDKNVVQTKESQKPKFNCTVTMYFSSCSLCFLYIQIF